MPRQKPPALDLAAMLPSWELALRAERKSPQTIKSYGDGVRAFIRWCTDNGHTPALDRELVKGFVAGLLDGGAEPATARVRLIIWCRRCRHQAEPDPAELAKRYGAATAALDWRDRLVCSQCGSRDVDMVVTGTERR